MIAYIKGKILSADDNVLVIENNGLGYEVVCSAAAKTRLLASGGGEVYTYLSVREDGVSLFGFDSPAEKNMFLKLISVSGVGPKMGIGILSGISLNDLAIAIAASDIKTLSKIKGLGKKTAERIVLELREAITLTDPLPSQGKTVAVEKLSTLCEYLINNYESRSDAFRTEENPAYRNKKIGSPYGKKRM